MRHLKLIVLFVGFFITNISAYAQEGIDARELFKSDEIRMASMSPEGRYLALIYTVGDHDQISIFDLTTNKTVSAFELANGRIAGQFLWASEDRFLIREGIKKYGYYDFPVFDNTLISSRVDGKQKRKHLGQSDGSMYYEGYFINSVLPDEPRKILISKYSGGDTRYFLYKLDLITSRTKKVGSSPVRKGYVYTDEAGNPRIAEGTSAKDINLISYKPTIDSKWVELENDDNDYNVHSLTKDGKIAYLYSTKNSDTDKLLSFELATGEFKELYHNSEVDISYSLVENNGYISAVVTELDYPVVEFLGNTEGTSLLKALSQTFKNGKVSIKTVSKDNTKVLFSVWNDANPTSYYLYDVPNKKISIVAQSLEQLKDYPFKSMQHISFTSRDDININAYLTKATDAAGPTIILPHGGPHGPRDYWGFDSEVQYFASHGFNVLQVNFRGSGGYGVKFEELGYKNWGTTMQDDLTDATNWAIENGIADKDKICIYGASYGGYAAMMATVREPDLYQCAIGYVGVYDLPLMYGEGDVPESPEGKVFLEKVLGTDKADLRSRSPVYNVDKIKADILLIHGKKDVRAHYEHYKRLTKALKKAGIEFESLVKDGEAHGFYKDKNRVEAYEKMLAFLKKHTQ